MSVPTPSATPVRADGAEKPHLAPTITFTRPDSGGSRVHIAARVVNGDITQLIQGVFPLDEITQALEGAGAQPSRLLEPAA